MGVQHSLDTWAPEKNKANQITLEDVNGYFETLKVDPGNEEANYKLGLWYQFVVQDSDEAIVFYVRACQTSDRSSPYTWYNRTQIDKSNDSVIEERLNKILSIPRTRYDPAFNGMIHRRYGKIMLDKGRHDSSDSIARAESHLRQAVELGDGEACWSLGVHIAHSNPDIGPSRHLGVTSLDRWNRAFECFDKCEDKYFKINNYTFWNNPELMEPHLDPILTRLLKRLDRCSATLGLPSVDEYLCEMTGKQSAVVLKSHQNTMRIRRQMTDIHLKRAEPRLLIALSKCQGELESIRHAILSSRAMPLDLLKMTIRYLPCFADVH